MIQIDPVESRDFRRNVEESPIIDLIFSCWSAVVLLVSWVSNRSVTNETLPTFDEKRRCLLYMKQKTNKNKESELKIFTIHKLPLLGFKLKLSTNFRNLQLFGLVDSTMLKEKWFGFVRIREEKNEIVNPSLDALVDRWFERRTDGMFWDTWSDH